MYRTTNPDDLRKQIGEKLKQARIEKGMSQQKLGKILGITHPAVGSYERGRLRITIQQLLLLCNVLEKPVSFFVSDDKEIVQKDEAFQKKKAVIDNYNLNESLEFSLEMSLRSYLKSKGVIDINKKVEKLMRKINKEISDKL